MNEVNSRAKVPSNKTIKRYIPVEQTSFAKKLERQIPKRHRSSIKKTSVVHEKTMSPRSCLRWKPTGKIFKTVGLRWVPTGNIHTSSTTKVDSEPTNGNRYECEQTLDVSTGTPNLSASKSLNPKKEGLRSELGIHDHSNELSSSKLVPKVVPPAAQGHLHHVTSWNYSFSINITMLKMELVMPIPAKDGIHYNMRSRYQVYQGRLLASFQDDAKYEHVGQDTRRIAMVAESAHVGKDKDLKI
ncbi:hypothetical protein Tco_1276989 [Tanacetum coccineum]